MAPREDQRSELSVFKGREAKLNRAIFHIIGLQGPQTSYDTQKEMKKGGPLKSTHYASVNKRMRALKDEGYLKITAIRVSKAGSRKVFYDLTVKAYLAIKLDLISKENIIRKAEENTGLQILAALSSIPNDEEENENPST